MSEDQGLHAGSVPPGSLPVIDERRIRHSLRERFRFEKPSSKAVGELSGHHIRTSSVDAAEESEGRAASVTSGTVSWPSRDSSAPQSPDPAKPPGLNSFFSATWGRRPTSSTNSSSSTLLPQQLSSDFSAKGPGDGNQQQLVQPRDALLQYLRKHHAKDIQLAIFDSQRIKEEKNATINQYHVILKLDPLRFTEFDASLGNLLIAGTCSHLDFENACFHLLDAALSPTGAGFPEYVRVSVRLAYLPTFQEAQYASAQIRRRYGDKQADETFVKVRGEISGLYHTVHVVYSYLYRCTYHKCRNPNTLHITPDAQRHRVIKREADGENLMTTTSATLHEIDLTCSSCGKTMLESPVDRVTTGDHIELVGTLVPMRGHCVGYRYVTDYKMLVKVNNAHVLNWVPSLSDSRSYKDQVNLKENHLRTARKPDLFGLGGDVLPDPILALQHETLSPYAFTQKLVDSFCDQVVPRAFWRKAKLSMLLSLVSMPTALKPKVKAATPRQGIHILLHSDSRIPALERLVSSAVTLRRSCKWTFGSGTKHSKLNSSWAACSDGKSTASAKANSGIMMAELDKFSKGMAEELDDELAKLQEPAVGTVRKENLRVNSFCLWASAAVLNKKNGRSYQQGQTKQPMLQHQLPQPLGPLLSKFDIMLNLRNSSDGQFDELLARHILAHPVNEPCDIRNEFHLTLDDFAQFLHVAANIEVKLSEDCQLLLRSYFSALRTLVGNIANGSESMFATMETLVRLTSAHAKLCLRDTALVDDALVRFGYYCRSIINDNAQRVAGTSILLVEESMALSMGVSIMGFTSLPQDQENLTVLFGAGYSNGTANDVSDQGDSMEVDSVMGEDDDEFTPSDQPFNR
ncbi:MCM2/3/5 family-domain-containing protein [Powellomyces hirtus]|nr:MCM2/3/5 family-domain-containing protein [Powellomyces hirtus]